jgi:hypothetical protein
LAGLGSELDITGGRLVRPVTLRRHDRTGDVLAARREVHILQDENNGYGGDAGADPDRTLAEAAFLLVHLVAP